MTSLLTPPSPSPGEVGCPSCGGTLARGTHHCPGCGLSLVGPVAAELWHTDQQLCALQRRRGELIDWLRRHPAADVMPAEMPPTVRAGQRSWSGQQLLLAAGALLVVTAAVVFLAVAWSTLGVAGQVAVMGLLTVAAGAASLTLAGRRLTATAEALGVVAVGLAAVDLAAAHHLDLAGLRAVDATGYAAAAAALLAAACGALTWRRPSLLSFALATVVAGAVAPLLGAAAADPSVATVALVFLLTTTAAMGLAGALRSRRVVRESLLVVAAAYLLANWLVGVVAALDEPLLGTGGLAAAVSLVASAAVAAWSGITNGLGRARHPGWGCLALAVAAVTVTATAWHADASGTATAAVALAAAGLAAALTAAFAARGRPLAAGPVGVALLGLHLLAGLSLVVAEPAYLDGSELERSPLGWTLAGALLMTAAAAGLLARRSGRLRPAAVGYAALLVLVAAAQLAGPAGDGVTVVVLLVLAVLAAALAALRHDRSDELVLAGAWGLAWVAALGVSTFAAHPAALTSAALTSAALTSAALTSATLATAGLTAAAVGLLPRRGFLALPAALLCSASVWNLLLDRGVHTVEAYSLPLALMLGVLGLLRWRRDPGASSWSTLGSVLSVGLLPSAAATVHDGGLTRPLLVLVVAAAVLLLGVARGRQAPVVIGTLALVVVAVSQLAPWAVGLPRWLSFGSVGLLLLVLGARYEQRRRNARSAVAWVTALR